MRWGSAFGLLLTGIVSGSASAQMPGNATIGKEIALHNCASCHIVAANQDMPPIPNYGPRFAGIATSRRQVPPRYAISARTATQTCRIPLSRQPISPT